MSKQGWTYKKLGEVATLKSGYTPTSTDLLDKGELPYFKVGDMNKEGNERYLLFTSSFVNSTFKSFPKGSIVFPKNGAAIATNKKRILSQPSVVDLNTAVLIPIIKVDIDFLFFWISKIDFRKITRRGTIPTLDTKVLMQLNVPVPPVAEQERIVDELDLLSGIIEKKKEQLKAYDQLAQSIFYTMFGDPITNEKGWEVKKLGEVCINCDSLRKPITAKDRIKGSIPYYGASGVVDYVNDYIFDGEYLLVSEDGANLLARSTPIAFSIKGKTWVNNHAHVLQFETWFQQVFIEYSINLRDISMIVTGCAQPKLTQAAMNDMNISYPPLALQQEFAEKIEAIEQQKALIQQSIAEVQTLFDSRMDYWFG